MGRDGCSPALQFRFVAWGRASPEPCKGDSSPSSLPPPQVGAARAPREPSPSVPVPRQLATRFGCVALGEMRDALILFAAVSEAVSAVRPRGYRGESGTLSPTHGDVWDIPQPVPPTPSPPCSIFQVCSSPCLLLQGRAGETLRAPHPFPSPSAPPALPGTSPPEPRQDLSMLQTRSDTRESRNAPVCKRFLGSLISNLRPELGWGSSSEAALWVNFHTAFFISRPQNNVVWSSSLQT